MTRDRILATFVVTVIGLVAFGLLKPTSPDPQDNAATAKAWFFVNKTHQEPTHDMVIIGDSRALRGVSPSAMEEVFQGRSVFNFAFHAGGMNDEIYRAAEDIINSDSEQKTILLAPTALSFMPIKQSNSQFHEYSQKARDVVWEYQKMRWMSEWFQPIAPGLILRNLLGYAPMVVLEQDFRPDGWIATDQSPRDEFADLSLPRQRVSGHKISQEMVDSFMRQTRKWREEGVAVFAFFPPAYAPRIAMEDSVLGFDKATFIADFRESGGTWLDVKSNGYESYDGSHLVQRSAIELSQFLAESIVRLQ